MSHPFFHVVRGTFAVKGIVGFEVRIRQNESINRVIGLEYYFVYAQGQRISGSGARPSRRLPPRNGLVHTLCRVRLLFDGDLKKKKAKFFRLCTAERVVRGCSAVWRARKKKSTLVKNLYNEIRTALLGTRAHPPCAVGCARRDHPLTRVPVYLFLIVLIYEAWPSRCSTSPDQKRRINLYVQYSFHAGILIKTGGVFLLDGGSSAGGAGGSYQNSFRLHGTRWQYSACSRRTRFQFEQSPPLRRCRRVLDLT